MCTAVRRSRTAVFLYPATYHLYPGSWYILCMHKPHTIKKIGFYDSGLGGLFTMQAVVAKFPAYDYVFLADEKNLPYGDKAVSELLGYARQCLDFLIIQEHCDVILFACNTLSATVYETLSLEYRKSHPEVLLLDVISPTIDFLEEDSHFSVFATPRTIESHIYKNELLERFPKTHVDEYAALQLASIIEERKDATEYLTSFVSGVHKKPHTIVLGCTHYGIVLDTFKKVFGEAYTYITQNEIIVDMFSFILHHDTTKSGGRTIYTTKENPVLTAYAQVWFPSCVVTVREI